MPNCDFYAVHDDIIGLAQFIFSETDCVIYESCSQPNKDLRCFTVVDELEAVYKSGFGGGSFLSEIYSPSMRGDIRIVRTDWEAKAWRPASWRFDVTGWGLIQLHLEGVHENRIRHSHTNHNTEKRVRVREELYIDKLGPASAWDWKAVTAISSKINRFIRKMSPEKSGPLPIMRSASQMVARGKAELVPR